jgi:hypothetical protein
VIKWQVIKRGRSHDMNKEFKPSQHIHIKLSGRGIEEVTIKAVIEHTDGIRLQVDFGHDQTALIELWQVVKD